MVQVPVRDTYTLDGLEVDPQEARIIHGYVRKPAVPEETPPFHLEQDREPVLGLEARGTGDVVIEYSDFYLYDDLSFEVEPTVINSIIYASL